MTNSGGRQAEFYNASLHEGKWQSMKAMSTIGGLVQLTFRIQRICILSALLREQSCAHYTPKHVELKPVILHNTQAYIKELIGNWQWTRWHIWPETLDRIDDVSHKDGTYSAYPGSKEGDGVHVYVADTLRHGSVAMTGLLDIASMRMTMH